MFLFENTIDGDVGEKKNGDLKDLDLWWMRIGLRVAEVKLLEGEIY